MKHGLLAHIVTLILAIQITAISTNVLIVIDNNEVSKDVCVKQKSKNKKNPLPILPELEEEEEIITHNKNWSIISETPRILISTIAFGYHLIDVHDHTLETSSPPPRA
ncbi:MAG: hypothetical protein RLO81_11195 [Fulvivirga sp.]|uniref:hypothetical protein n=1 Tax=Fulvivirga sp. TaxID=1931237 RepID=UPI0032EF8469